MSARLTHLLVLTAVVFAVACPASPSLAAVFAPTPMKISGADMLPYEFDGSTLTIPFTLTGSPALVKLAIFTRSRADQIINVRNGYLGWHYVDKIDTCIYVSPGHELLPGNQTIMWNGKNQDGVVLNGGYFTYYLWGYDNVGEKVKAVPYSQWTFAADDYLVWDDTGTKLAQPILWGQHTATSGNSANKIPPSRTEFRWTLGSDPDDMSLAETCQFILPEGWQSSDYGAWSVDMNDNDVIYGRTYNSTTATGRANKYNWAPNDVGPEDVVFGVEFDQLTRYGGSEYDDTYVYYGEANYTEVVSRTRLHVIDYTNTPEGEYVGFIDQTDVFSQPEKYTQYENQPEQGVLMNSGWTQSAFYEEKGWMIGGSHCACLRVACEPLAWFDDLSDDTIRWENGNGDNVVFDTQADPTSSKPWVCASLGVTDFANYGFGVDKNGIVEAGEHWGAVSFHAVTPDGTGFGRFSFAGETDTRRAGYAILDDDSAYDGAYVSETAGGTYWVGRDSFKGIIGQSVDDWSHVELTYPNAESVLAAGKTTDITWSNSSVHAIWIQFSHDNGTTWTALTDSLNADLETFSWAVPDIESTQCYIRFQCRSYYYPYELYLRAINDAPFTITRQVDVQSTRDGQPHEFALLQSSPNPFNAVTTITFSLPSAGETTLNVYSQRGQKVRTLVAGHRNAGQQTVVWDGTDDHGNAVSSGVYLSQLMCGKNVATGRMVLVK